MTENESDKITLLTKRNRKREIGDIKQPRDYEASLVDTRLQRDNRPFQFGKYHIEYEHAPVVDAKGQFHFKVCMYGSYVLHTNLSWRDTRNCMFGNEPCE